MKKTFFALAAASLFTLGAVSQAQAATQTLTFSQNRAAGATDWSDVLGLGKFDTNLGTLTSIRFDLSGLVRGTGSAESLEATPADVTLTLASTLTLYRPDASTLVVTNPLFSRQLSLDAYDGTIDFGGASGGTTGPRTSNAQNDFTSTSASDFALFSAAGGGLINLGLDAVGASSATGSGNLVTQFQTEAAGHVRVTYEYVSAVPEPETYVMLLTGLALAGVMARRKSAKGQA